MCTAWLLLLRLFLLLLSTPFLNSPGFPGVHYVDQAGRIASDYTGNIMLVETSGQEAANCYRLIDKTFGYQKMLSESN